MIESGRDDIPEETEFECIDLGNEGLGISEAFSTFTKANHTDRVRFEQIPNESRVVEKRAEPAPYLTDLLCLYYRSMGKIPLLTREQEVYVTILRQSRRLSGCLAPQRGLIATDQKPSAS